MTLELEIALGWAGLGWAGLALGLRGRRGRGIRRRYGCGYAGVGVGGDGGIRITQWMLGQDREYKYEY